MTAIMLGNCKVPISNQFPHSPSLFSRIFHLGLLCCFIWVEFLYVVGNMEELTCWCGTMQATRHARRVYVGGLPPVANEQVGHLPINCLLNEYPYYYKQGVRAGLCVMGIFFCYMNHIRGCTICGCTKNIFMLKTVRVAIL
jgi:hypothetical protein